MGTRASFAPGTRLSLPEDRQCLLDRGILVNDGRQGGRHGLWIIRFEDVAADGRPGGPFVQATDNWKRVVDKFTVEEASTEPMITLIADDNWMEFTLRYVVD